MSSLRASLCLLIVAALPAFGSLNTPNLIAQAEGPSGATVFFNVTTDDVGEGRSAETATCAPASGSIFSIGATTVSCVGSLGSTGSFTVTVVDTTAPRLTIPFDFGIVTTSPSGQTVTYSASAYDLVDGNVAINCTPASGSLFPLGTTTVSCTAADSRGNTARDSFNVTLSTTAVTPNITAEATGPDGANVTFRTAGDDGSDGRSGSACTPVSGSLFPLGTTTVTCAQSTFTVTVVDTTPPTLSLPADIDTLAPTTSGVAVSYSASASDLVDGSVSVVCTPPSGSTFPAGSTTVHCSATDTHGNRADGSFVVRITVPDTTPPVVTLPNDLLLDAAGPGGSVATFVATAFDAVDGNVPVFCTPPSGSLFPIATTTVTCTATDASNNTASGAFTITVADLSAPVITSVSASPATLWPPDRKLVSVTISVVAHDAVDPAPVIRIVSITCNETISAGDAVITGLLSAKLSADRDAKGTGRIYTLTIEAVDASGNRSTSTTTVTVPHDLGGAPPSSSSSRSRAVGHP